MREPLCLCGHTENGHSGGGSGKGRRCAVDACVCAGFRAAYVDVAELARLREENERLKMSATMLWTNESGKSLRTILTARAEAAEKERDLRVDRDQRCAVDIPPVEVAGAVQEIELVAKVAVAE